MDTVSDVLDVTEDAIEPAPDLGAVDTSFLTGLAKFDERLVALLNVERLFGEANVASN